MLKFRVRRSFWKNFIPNLAVDRLGGSSRQKEVGGLYEITCKMWQCGNSRTETSHRCVCGKGKEMYLLRDICIILYEAAKKTSFGYLRIF